MNACLIKGPRECNLDPSCKTYETEVDRCDGLNDCRHFDYCDVRYYCQIKPECIGVDISSHQDVPESNHESSPQSNDGNDNQSAPINLYLNDLSINSISACDIQNLSQTPCSYGENYDRTCFIYRTEDPCLGEKIQYCRPQFDAVCDAIPSCSPGDLEIDACRIHDDTCYTLNTCGGTVFCLLPTVSCVQAQAPVEIPLFTDCEEGIMNSEACSAQELEMNACGAMIVQNRCMGSDLYYCHLSMAQCTAVPACQDFEMEVTSCEGLENCVSHSICGATIYCQTKT